MLLLELRVGRPWEGGYRKKPILASRLFDQIHRHRVGVLHLYGPADHHLVADGAGQFAQGSDVAGHWHHSQLIRRHGVQEGHSLPFTLPQMYGGKLSSCAPDVFFTENFKWICFSNFVFSLTLYWELCTAAASDDFRTNDQNLAGDSTVSAEAPSERCRLIMSSMFRILPTMIRRRRKILRRGAGR